MRKKIMVGMFVLGFASLVAAVVTAVPKKEAYYREENVAVTPFLLSDIRMNDYVSLPVFEGMEIEESSSIKTEEKAREDAYQELLRTARKLDKPAKNCTFICDITISQEKNFIDKLINYSMSAGSETGKAVMEYLTEFPEESRIRLEHTSFQTSPDVNLDIEIKGIYDIPYPVTDSYMKGHTEYNSFNSMVRSYIQNGLNESRSFARQETMSSLIDQAIAKTTFMEIPESLCDQEFEALKKENPAVQFDDAKKSLKKIFFISAVMQEYSLADEKERTRVLEKYMEEHSAELEGYEAERMSYLLFEDDINNYLYKIINITENATDLAAPLTD